MSFFYGSEKSRDFVGINSIDGFESKLKEMTDRLNSLSEYEQQCEFIRHELKYYNNCHSIPQHIRLGVYHIAMSHCSAGSTAFTQKHLLDDLSLSHNSLTKWNLFPRRDFLLFRSQLPNISLHRNGVKRGDMLALIRLLLISQNADTFCDLFGGLGSVTKAVEWYFKHSYCNDIDNSVYKLLCTARNNGDINSMLEEIQHNRGWRTYPHSYTDANLPQLEKAHLLNCDFEQCYKYISENHKVSDLLFYADPPYFCTAQYTMQFSDSQHIQLIEMLKRISADGGKFVLSIKNRVTNKRLYCENPRKSSYRYGTDGSGEVIKNFKDYLMGILPEYKFRRSGEVFELVRVPKSSQPKNYDLYVYRLSNDSDSSDIVITNFYCPTGITYLINSAVRRKTLPNFNVMPYREHLKQFINNKRTAQT